MHAYRTECTCNNELTFEKWREPFPCASAPEMSTAQGYLRRIDVYCTEYSMYTYTYIYAVDIHVSRTHIYAVDRIQNIYGTSTSDIWGSYFRIQKLQVSFAKEPYKRHYGTSTSDIGGSYFRVRRQLTYCHRTQCLGALMSTSTA